MKPINQSNFLTKIIFENRNFLYNIFIVSKPVKFLSLNQLGGFYTIKTLVTISLNPFVLRLTVLKWNFPLRIFLVNVKKSARNCGFVYIY